MTKFKTPIPLLALSDLNKDITLSMVYNELNLLIIKEGKNIFIIEDRCGHFGVSLQAGKVSNGTIRCSAHGAVFDLLTGKIQNNFFDDCEPIKIYQWRKNNDWLEIFL